MKKELDLTPFRKNNFSQFGEDGVIAKLFEILKIDSGWLVEVGAWDGVHLSNVRCHYNDNLDKFKVLFIEGDTERYNELKKNYPEDKVICLNSYVGIDPNMRLLHCLIHNVIKDIALLSLDTDGTEVEIWKDTIYVGVDKSYTPKIVIIEEGGWQSKERLDYLIHCFNGYNLVCVTSNFIFVRKDLGITSKHNVHELLASSGSPEYNLFHRNINKIEFENIVFRMEHGDKDIFTKLAGPQIIEYEE